MKKSLANQIAKLWNENFAGYTAETKTKAVVTENGRNDYAVEVNPTDGNDGRAFFAHAELTDIERTFKVSAYVTQDKNDILTAGCHDIAYAEMERMYNEIVSLGI